MQRSPFFVYAGGECFVSLEESSLSEQLFFTLQKFRSIAFVRPAVAGALICCLPSSSTVRNSGRSKSQVQY